MSDTKISALTANTTPVSTDITVIVDDPGGTPLSQKITLANLMALFANPVSDDGDSLGTTSLKWSDLFLASGAVVNFNNGNVTLTHAAGSLTIAGGGLVLAAGTTSLAPLKLQAGTNLTTPEDGGVEFDGTCFYATGDAGNRGVVSCKHFIRQAADRTTVNDTNENPIFDSVTNGRLTLEAGAYFFHAMMYLTGMSSSSGNLSVDILGAGTATVEDWLWQCMGVDATTATNAASPGGSFAITQQSVASIVSAGLGSQFACSLRGTFDVTTGGTLIPSLTLTHAAAATLKAGSYFWCERVGATGAVSCGQWD